MKDKLLSRISNIVALVLLAVSVVIVLAMYVGPVADSITNAGGDVMNVPAATDTLIYWCYALLIATVVAAIGFAAYKFISNLIINPKGGIKTIVTLAVFALLIIVAWNLGSPEKLPIIGYEGTENEGFWAQFTDMVIYVCYTLFVLVFLAIIGNRLYTKFK